MGFKDFRDYLDSLEKHGLLVRVKKEVDVKFEIAAGIRKICDNNGPALLYENIKGHPGWKAVGGLFGTRRLTAFALEIEEDENKMMKRYLDFESQRVKPVHVKTGPVKDVIIKGDDVDLSKLPIPTYCEHDAGPYITAGVDIARHPDTGAQNVTILRRMPLNKNTTSTTVGQMFDLDKMIRAAEEKGQGLGVATVMGVHPSLTLASQIKVPLGVDEIEIAGAMRGRPFEVVKCETIDVDVPVDAEVVIEGNFVPGERIPDGPFGEYPGNYISLSKFVGRENDARLEGHVIKVTAITMRKDPIYHAMATGMVPTENHYLKKWAYLALIYKTIASVVPYPDDIRGLNLTVGGCCNFHLVVSIHKRIESTPRNIIYSIAGMAIQAVGHVVVVDEDIDVYDPVQVEWATATRVRPDRDIIIIPPVEPAPEAISRAPIYTYKWSIDATAPITEEPWLYSRAVPPGVDKVDFI